MDTLVYKDYTITPAAVRDESTGQYAPKVHIAWRGSDGKDDSYSFTLKERCSTFGSNNTIWLKVKRNSSVFLNTLIRNLCLVRVHAFVPREISLLQGQNLSLRFSTTSVQSVQEDVENPQETARRQASSYASGSSESSIAGRPHAEKSRATLWAYPSRFDSAFSPRPAVLRIAHSGFALAKRALGFGLGWTLLSLSRRRLGRVCDGGQAVPSKSSLLPRPCSPAGQREHAGLVSGIHNDPRPHTQTDPGFGLRRGFRNYQARQEPRLDRAALPFPSHQPLAELPRPTQSQIGRQTLARSALPACPKSSRAARRPPVANRRQKTAAARSPSNRLARHAHDRSRVSQARRPFQSLSKISRTASADYYGQCRSYEPKSP